MREEVLVWINIWLTIKKQSVRINVQMSLYKKLPVRTTREVCCELLN